MGNSKNWMEEKITVCDACLMACCWQGRFMCDDARDAGTVQKTRRELLALARENKSFMKTDKQLCRENR